MIIYLAALILSMFFFRQMQLAETLNHRLGRSNFSCWVWFLFAFLVLGLVVSTRHYVGTDYGNYIDVYLVSSWNSYEEILKEPEALFGILNYWCFHTFDDYIPVFVISGMLSVFLILYGIYKNSDSPWLSVFLLITAMYYFDLFNGMRQMIATAIMFAAYPLLQKKKWIPLIILTIIATNIHASSYVVLLVFFYSAYVPPKSLISILIAAIFGGLVILYGDFAVQLVNALNATDSMYTNYEDTLVLADQGANVLRFGLVTVPVAISTLIWPVLKRQRSDIGILWNISFINALFMLLATRHWIFARFCMFFGIYNTLLWPEIIKCFEPRSRRLMLAGVMTVYFLYFWLIVHTDSNLLPYKSWLFGGIYG